MICNICKEREATIEFTAVVGDAKKTLHLCQECSKQQGSEQGDNQAESPAQKVPLEHVVETKKVDVVIGLAGTETGKGPCPGCGMTYDEFRKVGRLGCSHCYEAFATPLRRLLKRIHGSDTHVGRGPRSSGPASPAENADVQRAVGLRSVRQLLQLASESVEPSPERVVVVVVVR